MGRLRAAFALLVCTAFAEDPHIGTIDFYGYRSLDLAQLRAALPYHVGDPVPPRQARSEVEKTYAKAVGRARAAITAICCLPDGRTSLFVGLEDPAAPMLTFHPKPAGSAKLPPEVLQLYRDMDRLNEIAVKSGHAGEDDSHGYSLSNYPPQRALELMLRDYARAHTATLYRVLENCPDDESRAAAAEALGYADESKRQIAGLVRASLDPNDDVRNNAIRALGVLVEFDPKALRLVPLKPYIALIHSIDWFDRNKTVFLLESFTNSRDPRVLRALRSQSLAPLCEIASWDDQGHSFPAIHILGRVAGFSEERILELSARRDLTPILDELR